MPGWASCLVFSLFEVLGGGREGFVGQRVHTQTEEEGEPKTAVEQKKC